MEEPVAGCGLMSVLLRSRRRAAAEERKRDEPSSTFSSMSCCTVPGRPSEDLQSPHALVIKGLSYPSAQDRGGSLIQTATVAGNSSPLHDPIACSVDGGSGKPADSGPRRPSQVLLATFSLATPQPSAPLPALDSCLRTSCHHTSNSATSLAPSQQDISDPRSAVSLLRRLSHAKELQHQKPQQREESPRAQDTQHVVRLPTPVDTLLSVSGCATPNGQASLRNSLSQSSYTLANSGLLSTAESVNGEAQQGTSVESPQPQQPQPVLNPPQSRPRVTFGESTAAQINTQLLGRGRSTDPPATSPQVPWQQQTRRQRPPGCDLVISEPETADKWQDAVLLGMLFDSSLVLGPGSGEDMDQNACLFVGTDTPPAGQDVGGDQWSRISQLLDSEELVDQAPGTGSTGPPGRTSAGGGSSSGSIGANGNNSKVRIVSVGGAPLVLVNGHGTSSSATDWQRQPGGQTSMPLLPWSPEAAAAAAAAAQGQGHASWPRVSMSDVQQAVGGMTASSCSAPLPSTGHRNRRSSPLMRPLSGMSSQDLVSIAEDVEEDC